MGIDLGTRRIGVATSDATGTLASPCSVIERRGDRAADHAAIAVVVAEVEAERVVVGLPLSLSGRRGPAAEAALAEVEELAAVLPVPVETYDERLTTVSADRALQAAGTKGRDRRRTIDSAAAAVMLQAWLDSRSGRRNPADRPDFAGQNEEGRAR